MYEITYIDITWLSSDELASIAMYPAAPTDIRAAAIQIILNRETSND